MDTKVLLEYAIFADFFIGAGILAIMIRHRLHREFAFLSAFLAVNCFETCSSIMLLFFRKELGISGVVDYEIYFYSHWALFFVEYALMLLVIYSVFRKAMKPLDGLHRAGKIIFRWIAGVSLALSLVMATGPHVAGQFYIATLAGQVQQGISVLTLCVLLFVCFSTRYLGLTYRSHIFGVSLGLGIFATVSLVESAWYANGVGQTVYSPVYLFSALGSCAALLTWATYFAMPEPERKMILLPTTSPFFLWNRISEALGDEPGFVAIAGFKPEMLAPAELTVFTAASKRAQERKVEEEIAEREAEASNATAQQALSMHRIAMPR
ncbi:MAG TPA: hypothetical protein VIJ38_16820 [Acidobacteriaceae bacterium]